ncbi:MAG: hypothetical protein Q4G49_17800, partial [Paracoccus sp. (in: a-proteobacteria)]|nr:hypothetical protein [Paracoccus sp. (in: a-proteobacteria)]
MERKVIAVRADKADRISYLKHFDYDPEELVYTTGKVTMGRYHDGSQYGEASLTIEGAQSGRADLIPTGRFENRRLVDGDHFVATAGLLDASGRALHHMRVKRGLDARFGGLFKKSRWRGGATARSSIDSMDDVAVIALAL